MEFAPCGQSFNACGGKKVTGNYYDAAFLVLGIETGTVRANVAMSQKMEQAEK
jgi:hypothetical protein